MQPCKAVWPIVPFSLFNLYTPWKGYTALGDTRAVFGRRGFQVHIAPRAVRGAVYGGGKIYPPIPLTAP